MRYLLILIAFIVSNVYSQNVLQTIEIKDSIIEEIRRLNYYKWPSPLKNNWMDIDLRYNCCKTPVIINEKLYKQAEFEIKNRPFKGSIPIKPMVRESNYRMFIRLLEADENNVSRIDYLNENGIDILFDNQYGTWGDSITLIWDGKTHNDSIILLLRILPYFEDSKSYYAFINRIQNYEQHKLNFDINKILKVAKRRSVKTILINSNWNESIYFHL